MLLKDITDVQMFRCSLLPLQLSWH